MPHRPLDALVAVGLGAALMYGWDMLAAARGGTQDDNTLGLMHLPMQAAFGLSRLRPPQSLRCGRWRTG